VRRLLVTGGAGFIGCNFVHHWLHECPSDRVVVLDALTYAGNLANLESATSNPSFSFVEGDISNTESVAHLLREQRIDTIVHFAAESHVDRSIDGPDLFIQTNVVGTHSLLKAAKQVWLNEKAVSNHRFHHISTDEVYGSLGPDEPAFAETTPYAPNSPYSASKAASDHLVRAYFHTYGLEVSTSNCSNNYGPYQFPEKLIPLMIVSILEGRPLPVYGDGKNILDWLHVDDHCRGIEQVIRFGRPGRVYNIGGRSEMQNIDVVRTLCGIADELFAANPQLCERFPRAPAGLRRSSAELISFVKDRAGHDRRYAVDGGRIERELSFVPQIDLGRGLRQTFAWYVANESWWRTILSRVSG
jgi:dTDP-glucose 4,6-dehydratase